MVILVAIYPVFNLHQIGKGWYKLRQLTSLFNAAVAVKRSAGSIERSVSISRSADCGKSLNVSAIRLLYGCWGLNMVACGNFDFFQYSSAGDPHSLNILCNCST
jgi:hypothetical protein